MKCLTILVLVCEFWKQVLFLPCPAPLSGAEVGRELMTFLPQPLKIGIIDGLYHTQLNMMPFI